MKKTPSPGSAPLAGVATGIRFAVKSLEPSLMPRSAIDQGIIMGGSFLTGFIVGTTAGTLLAPVPGSGPALRAIGVASAGSRTTHMVRGHNMEQPTTTDQTEAWGELSTEVVSSLALVGIGGKSSIRAGGVAAAGAVVASTVFDAQEALANRSDTPDAEYLATATGVAVGLNVAVAGIGVALFTIARLPIRIARRSGALPGLLAFGGAAVTFGAIAVGIRTLLGTLMAKIASGNRATEIEFASSPESDAASGSRFSLAAYESLGLQGRRLVSERTTTSEITELMDEPAISDPVRVYVGLATADSEDDRIDIAIQELRRAGGFDRSTIIAASPAGTGYVNYIAIEAAEYMSLGDVATVAVQYGELPSMLSVDKVAEASHLYAKLVGRLREEIETTGRPTRLLAYGESLGAIACQNGVLEASRSANDLVVDGALWVGTPFGSVLFDELAGADVPVFDEYSQLQTHLSNGEDLPPVLFLNHDNDPVTKFTPSIAYRMPTWLQTEERGRGMDPHQRWLPGIAFWQGLIDTKNAATVVPGEFFSTGHDYRADLAEFVRKAYGFDGVTDEQMIRIEQQLRESEITRAERISVGKIQID